MFLLIICFLQFNVIVFAHPHVSEERSFTIDYDRNIFLKDGEPFRYISGSIHYFRVPREHWQDRFHKAKMAGLNAIQTYVAWNAHETFQGKYNFQDKLDIVSYIKLAQQNDLLVILRPGPYIDAEWEYGGYPYWLANLVPKKIRTSDKVYLNLVDQWFSVLLPKIQPLLYKNGGPIISVQVENEYGSFGCDSNYMTQMEILYRKYLHEDVILFTTDPIIDQAVECGSLPSLFTTVDFSAGNEVEEAFAIQRKYQPNGPLVNSEFYTGWFDLWGISHSTETPAYISMWLDLILKTNASVNMYMFEGGSNINFMNGGSYLGEKYFAVTTTYDYDAPLSEAGDPTEKYWQIQKVISKYNKIPEGPQPEPTKKLSYRKLNISMGLTFFYVERLVPPVVRNYPSTFEMLDLAYGYMWYRKIFKEDNTSKKGGNSVQLLDLGQFRDRAYVYVDSKFQGILSRNNGSQMNITQGKELSIVVENEGRTCFTDKIESIEKGILSNVTLNGEVLNEWLHILYGIKAEGPYSDSSSSLFRSEFLFDMKDDLQYGSLPWPKPPAFYAATLELEEVADTYLKLAQWGKGFAIVNNINAHRYWTDAGPQKTLFIPKGELKELNSIVLFETDRAPLTQEEAYIELVENPIFD